MGLFRVKKDAVLFQTKILNSFKVILIKNGIFRDSLYRDFIFVWISLMISYIRINQFSFADCNVALHQCLCRIHFSRISLSRIFHKVTTVAQSNSMPINIISF